MRRGQLTYSIVYYKKSKEELQYEIDDQQSYFLSKLKWEVPNIIFNNGRNMPSRIFTFDELRQEIYQSLCNNDFFEVEKFSIIMNEFNKKRGNYMIICIH